MSSSTHSTNTADVMPQWRCVRYCLFAFFFACTFCIDDDQIWSFRFVETKNARKKCDLLIIIISEKTELASKMRSNAMHNNTHFFLATNFGTSNSFCYWFLRDLHLCRCPCSNNRTMAINLSFLYMLFSARLEAHAPGHWPRISDDTLIWLWCMGNILILSGASFSTANICISIIFKWLDPSTLSLCVALSLSSASRTIFSFVYLRST